MSQNRSPIVISRDALMAYRNQQAAAYRDALLQEAAAVPQSNTWPKPISVKQRMPAEPDADCSDLYLGFLSDEGTWGAVEWHGKFFTLQWGDDDITEVVTHWMPMPPDPPRDTEVQP